jgi:transposase
MDGLLRRWSRRRRAARGRGLKLALPDGRWEAAGRALRDAGPTAEQFADRMRVLGAPAAGDFVEQMEALRTMPGITRQEADIIAEGVRDIAAGPQYRECGWRLGLCKGCSRCDPDA